MVDAAEVLDNLRFPPGNHLEALKGNRTGQHSIRINDQYRVCLVSLNPKSWVRHLKGTKNMDPGAVPNWFMARQRTQGGKSNAIS